MTEKETIKTSKFLSLILRHEPEQVGLTLGEARVASAVGSGLSPKIVATQLGITENTVRTVLQRVFQKADISRQSELVSLLTRLSIR